MIKKFILTAVTTVMLTAPPLQAHAATNEELKQELDAIKSQIKALTTTSQQKADEAIKPAPSTETLSGGYIKQLADKTRFGGYGELNYIFRKENGNGKGGNIFDPHRIVLYVDSPLADWIDFKTELEWEHGGVTDELNADNELSGEARVEQAFLNFKLADYFNIKAGVMLVPVGAINLYHEPTSFNSGERPQLDQILIPSTWSEMGAGIHGSLGSKADYQILIMNGLDGSKFSAAKGIRGGRQNFNEDVNRSKSLTGRLELRPFTNLYTNFSFYTGDSGKNTSAYTTLAAFDGKYSVSDFDLAGEYVFIYQDKPASLGVTDIGHTMSGYWVEGAYHIMPAVWKKGKLSAADAKLFVRWSEFNTQEGQIVDPAQKSGRFDRNYTTVGIAFNPVNNLVVKADYQFYGDHRSAGETPLDNDKFQLSLGFMF